MSDLSQLAIGEMSYSSPLIIDRRRRILRETRHMISRGGLEGFSIRELCKLSGVAQRTIYNAFGSKEKVISIAIRQYYDDFALRVQYSSESSTLAGALERVIIGNLRSRQVRNYTQALVAVYFSPSVNLDIRAEMRKIANDHMTAWLRRLQVERRLRPTLILDELSDTLVDLQYLMLLDWCRGLVADERALPRLAEAVLLVLAGALRGTARAEVTQMLDAVYMRGPAWEALVARAERAAAAALASDQPVPHETQETPG